MIDHIAGIRARLAAIAHVPTPWRQRVGDPLLIESAENGEVAECGFAHDAFSGEAIAELIANAPADLAYLLAELDRLRHIVAAGDALREAAQTVLDGPAPEFADWSAAERDGSLNTALAAYTAARGEP